MQPGEKLNLNRSIRSAKTGSLLPKEGTLVSVIENLDRTLLLVEFARGHREYVFENEVDSNNIIPLALTKNATCNWRSVFDEEL